MHLPNDFDWECWVERFERMQKRYLVRWEERLETIIRLLKARKSTAGRIVDLGCGAGSLSERILKAIDGCEIIAIDFDPTLLMLAEVRLRRFGKRSRIVRQDLREESWPDCIKSKVHTLAC